VHHGARIAVHAGMQARIDTHLYGYADYGALPRKTRGDGTIMHVHMHMRGL